MHGLEVEPDSLRKTAKDYADLAAKAKDDVGIFACQAQLTADDWGHTSASWKMANNWETTHNGAVKDMEAIAETLKQFGHLLAKAATSYERMEKENVVTVKPGDTLWAIAGKKLGDPKRYPEIAAANPQIKNPDLIHPGDKIKVRPESKLKIKLPWPGHG